MIEHLINALEKRVAALPRGGIAELARRADVPVRTTRQMAKRGFRTVTTENLTRIERALDEIEREGNAA